MTDEDRRAAEIANATDETQVGEQIVDELLDMISGALHPTVFAEGSWHRKF